MLDLQTSSWTRLPLNFTVQRKGLGMQNSWNAGEILYISFRTKSYSLGSRDQVLSWSRRSHHIAHVKLPVGSFSFRTQYKWFQFQKIWGVPGHLAHLSYQQRREFSSALQKCENPLKKKVMTHKKKKLPSHTTRQMFHVTSLKLPLLFHQIAP